MTPEQVISIWQRAYRIRQVELEIVRRYYPDPSDRSNSPMRTPLHLSIGQEVLASTVREVIGADSHCYSGHRSHAHYLAWGGDLKAMVAELYGKATGCARGWGGSMHLRDASVGFMGGTPIVGSSISIAVGDALAAKLAGETRIVVAFIGDAVLETGQFWEAWNFARLHDLRLMVIIEDNGLSTATPKNMRQPAFPIQREVIHHYQDPDPAMPEGIYSYALNVAGNSHTFGYPKIGRFPTTRFFEHVGVGRDSWREVPELDSEGDALHVLEGMLPANYDRTTWKLMVAAEVNEAFTAAENAPWPEVAA